MNIVFLLGLLVCGSCYTTNKERLAKSNLYVNMSVADVHLESAALHKAKAGIKAALAIESKKFQQAVRNSTLFDVCLDLEKMKARLASTTTTTAAPGGLVSQLSSLALNPVDTAKKIKKYGKSFWITIEVVYWIVTIAATVATTTLAVQSAIKDTQGSSSIFTPLTLECYGDLKDVMSWFADTDMETYDDPCVLDSVSDCEKENKPLSPLRKLTKCVMDNMNLIVEYQRDIIIQISSISRVHQLADIIATHFNIEKSADNIKAELESDAEQDEEYDLSMVEKMCDLGKNVEDFENRFEASLQEILPMT
jgi:hypothetical protein